MGGREGYPQNLAPLTFPDPATEPAMSFFAPVLTTLAVWFLSATFAVAAPPKPTAPSGPPKVAVTDLTYEETVSEYFRVVSASQKSSLKASGSESERESAQRYSSRRNEKVDARSESQYFEAEGTYTYIDRGELRKFTADVKGEMVKSRCCQVMQGKPYTETKNTEKIYDIIDRIKKGYYPGSEYVLFGSVSSIQFRQEANPVMNTNTVSHTLSLELVADFSLINTKTYQVRAAFSAVGEGQDVKLLSSAGGRVVLNRGKVISETSKSLGADVIRQLQEQLTGQAAAQVGGAATMQNIQTEEVVIYR
jgi:hypothetical protein